MTRILHLVLASLLAMVFGSATRAGDGAAQAIVDKAVKAMGGADKLGAVKAVTWKAKGKISIGGADNDFTSQTTLNGLTQMRGEFEGDFMGNKIKGVTVVNGDKGWRVFGDQKMELDADAVANEKRNLYLQVVPLTIMPLKGKGFKVEAAGEEKVGGKAALAVKATGPDGKDFTIYFDKDSGLPVKQVAKIVGFMGDEVTQETMLGNYKDFGGIKKATKIDAKRDDENFLATEIVEFRVLNKVDPKTFAEPE
jgi:hypothetical protein